MVALNILYNVGSRDEDPELTGMAHLFEHLMFGGSENIPDFDSALESAGGTNNAWTNCDYTNFYDIIPAHNVETAFWLESDRMNALAFSDKALEVQRQVVCEEFKQVCLNQPYGDLSHHLNTLAYTVHPYRHPVIGMELSHIQKVTQEDVRQFFYHHYAPNNAVLAITGNITAERAFALAEKWFGPIPSRPIAPRNYLQEPCQTEARRKSVTGRVPHTVIYKAFHMPGQRDKCYPVCDTITDLLSAGQSSRFYRNLLLKTNLFSKVDASITGSDEPGLLLLSGHLRDGVTVEEAEDAIMREALSLVTTPPDEHELQRSLNRFESTLTFSNISYINLASLLAQIEMIDRDVNSIVPRQRETTIKDIVETTQRIITPENCSTLIYSPQ
jgi:predicted Zn-dependent peptidase